MRRIAFLILSLLLLGCTTPARFGTTYLTRTITVPAQGEDDNSAAFQAAIDRAAKGGDISRIYLAPGQHNLLKPVKVYGMGYTIDGHARTAIVTQAGTYTGQSWQNSGTMVWCYGETADRDGTGSAEFPLAVSSNTITLGKPTAFLPGDTLMLCNGYGGAAAVIKEISGEQPTYFRQRAPCQFVGVQSVSADNLSLTLTAVVIGDGLDYANVGQDTAHTYAAKVSSPAQGITISGISFRYSGSETNPWAVVPLLYVFGAKGVTVQNCYFTSVVGANPLTLVESQDCVVKNCTANGSMQVNSNTRLIVTGCKMQGITIEEAVRQSLFKGNTLSGGGQALGGMAFRVNDAACRDLVFMGNTFTGGDATNGIGGICAGTGSFIGNTLPTAAANSNVLWSIGQYRMTGNTGYKFLNWGKNTDFLNNWQSQ